MGHSCQISVRGYQLLKKLHKNLTSESTTTIKRPRERFLSERKLQWLLPQLTKLKHQHNEWRMYMTWLSSKLKDKDNVEGPGYRKKLDLENYTKVL